MGIYLGLQLLISAQIVLYTSIIFIPYIITVNKKVIFEKKNYFYLFNFLFTFFIVASPSIIPRLLHMPPKRSLESAIMNSVILSIRHFRWLSPGYIFISLFSLGIFIIYFNKMKNYYGIISTFILSILLILGPRHSFFPYRWIYNIWPLFKYVRTPQRFIFFTHISVSIVSSLGFKRIINNKTNLIKLIFFLLFLILNFIIHVINSRYFFQWNFIP